MAENDGFVAILPLRCLFQSVCVPLQLLIVFCRIVNGAPETVSSSNAADVRVGMVRDGSRCGIHAMCIEGECVSLDHVMPATCATGHNGLVCSGHGVSFQLHTLQLKVYK